MRDGSHLDPETLDAWARGATRVPGEAAVEAHLAGCEACREAVTTLRALTSSWDALRARDASAGPDAAFEARIAAALDAEDTAVASASLDPRRASRRRLGWFAIAAAAGLAGLLFWSLQRDAARGDLVAAAIEDGVTARAGRLALEIETEDPAVLERHFRASGIGFAVRVIDLGMMGWRVTGGGAVAFAGRPSALTSYRDTEGHTLVCRMFEAAWTELPAPAVAFAHGGIEFRIYEDRGITAVFWREGDVLCVLVSDLAPDAVRALAVAKAMPPT